MLKKTILDNGLTIVSEKRNFKNVSMGIFVKTGLINETVENNGISHLVEHMLFKGTETKSAFDLVNEIEKIGGECNAYTSDVSTCFYVNVLPSYWQTGLNFLLDIIQHSTFPEAELNKEKEVVIQEIARAYDNIETMVWYDLQKTIYKNQPLERTILGSAENVLNFTRKDLLEYVKKWYTPNNIIISVAGNIKHEEVVEYIKENWVIDSKRTSELKTIEYLNNSGTYEEDFDQAHVIVSLKGMPLTNEKDLLFYYLYTYIMSGGMSSKLFQELREKHGLVYSTYMVSDFFETTGFFGVYAGIDEKNINKTIEVIKNLLRESKSNITEDDLSKAKNMMLFNISMKNDNAYAAMTSNSNVVRYNLTYKSYAKIKKEIEHITLKDINYFTNKYITEDFNTLIVKPKGKE